MQLNLTPTFQKSLARLSNADQKAVNQAVMTYLMNPDTPGLRLHPLNCREKRFHSLSASMDVRIIVLKDGARHVLMYVDHHDSAYRWAERRQVETHPVTGSAQIVEFEEVVRQEIVPPTVTARFVPILAGEDDQYLLSLGVPPVYLEAVKSVDEDGLLELCGRLPEEAQEALLELAAGSRPLPAPVMVEDLVSDAFEHPDSKRRFWVATDEEALAQALSRPWAQWLVFLHPSQRTAVERNFNGPARVSGAAGTGKSVVAMHRAAFEARQSQGGRVLLTTFSKALASRLADGMDELLGPASALRGRVHVTHLHELAVTILTEAGLSIRVVDDATVRDLIRAHRAQLDPGEFPDTFLLAEWQMVVDYWGIRDWDSYRNIARAGRGTALPPLKRREIWPTFAALTQELTERSLMSWGDVCDRAREIVEAQGARPFRHVIVDEAQDLGPRELRLVNALAPTGPRALFFAGDRGQRIYRYPFAWVAAGVDVRGRAHRLKVNYRTSAQIRRFADRLLPDRVEEVDGDLEARQTVSLLSGPDPEIVGGSGVEGEISTLSNWLRGLVERGVEPSQIAIFARTRRAIEERVKPAIERAGLIAEPLSIDTDIPDGAVNVGTLHAAKGLEYRAVALAGCDAGILPNRSTIKSVAEGPEREEAHARERHLLYVGCTRARETLLITYSDRASPFLEEIQASKRR